MSTDVTVNEVWEIQIECFPKLNFALLQSGIPFIRNISICNNSDEDKNDLKLQISAIPEFISPKIFKISCLNSRQSWSLKQCDIKLNYSFFENLSETVNAILKLKLTTSKEEEILAEKDIGVMTFAANAWTGYSPMPQLLAAFVTPNLKSISEVQRQMSALLAKNGVSDALDGYQSSKAHVEEMVQAAYNVLANQRITYSEPPASFDGQRVRFASEIFREKLATCLDISLLFASILEQCGLHPLILLTKNHAFVGCHAVNTTFYDAFFEDLQAIRKRVELDEIFVFEATCVLGAKPFPFRYAELAAKEKLKQDDFEGALDVKQARKEHFMPLPLKSEDSGKDIEKRYEFEDVAYVFDDRIDRTHNRIEIEISTDETPQQNRLERWRNKLLDLSKNNRLINFKKNSKVVPLILHDIAELEDYLNLGKIFYLHPSTELMTGTDLRDNAILSKNIENNPTTKYLEEELKSSRLHSSYDEKTLDSKLLAIYRQARADIEEGGCNTLHIALGFLEWCEKEDINKRHCKAPILLLPVKLERKSISEGFTLSRADEDAMLNITLLEMLKQDFDMNIAGLKPEDLPKDDSGVDVKEILRYFQYAIKDTPGWEVKYEAWLGCFSFQKILMYNDLKNRADDLIKNPIVDHILNHPTEEYDDKIEMVREAEIDDLIKSQDIYCPLSADSSQISAVLSAARGKSFILFGPPGTGKSQTITNIIAHCLATKKKVLFVSEKKAALEVVYRRLQNIGLDPFCLELHSNKAGKTEVMRQFKEILDYDASLCDSKWDSITKQLDCLRHALQDYVKILHKRYPNGFSLYQAFSFLIAHHDKISQVPRLSFELKNLPVGDIQNIRNCAKDIEQNSKKFSAEHYEMLNCIAKSSWTPAWRDEVQQLCSQAISVIDNLVYQEKAFERKLGINISDICDAIFFQIIDIAGGIREKAAQIPAGLYSDDWDKVYPVLQKLISDVAARNDAIKKLTYWNFAQLVKSGESNLIANNHKDEAHLFYFSESIPTFKQSVSNLEWYRHFSDLIQQHLEDVQKFRNSVKKGCTEIGCNCHEFDEITASHLLALWRLIQKAPEIPETFFTADSAFIPVALDLCDTGIRYEKTTKLLANFNLEKIRKLDVLKLQSQFEESKDASNILKKITRFFLLKKIRSTLTDKLFEINYENAAEFLNIFVEHVVTYKKIRSISIPTSQALDSLWDYEKSDWKKLKNLLIFFQKLNEAIVALVGEDAIQIVRDKIKVLIVTQRDENKENCHVTTESLALACENYQKSLNDILKLFQNNWEQDNNTGKWADLLSMPVPEEHAGVAQNIDHCEFIEAITTFANKSSDISAALSSLKLSERLENIWFNGNLNIATWDSVHATISFIETLIQKKSLTEFLPTLRIKLGDILSSAISLEQIKSEGKSLVEDWGKYVSETSKIATTLEAKLDSNDIVYVRRILNFIVDNIEILHYWCNWRATCENAAKLQLDAFVNMATSLTKVCPVSLAVDIAMFQKFTYEIYDESETLRNFLGDHQNKIIQEFQRLDDEYTQLTCQKVQQIISAEMPSKHARTNTTATELGKLRSAVNRQRCIMPVRKLLSEFSTVALRLKPCMLMSPLSVAQYLPPGRSDFDLVIFDEASQITPWDALGAIARGKQLIVVGDPKQLPPTSFFQRQDETISSDIDNVPDEQSILDECIAANMKSQQLKWHYRSRHEDLIAFSNHYYYNNKLLTFPTVERKLPPLGVNFHFVADGVYCDKSNRIEAQELVNNVVERLQSPYFKNDLCAGKRKSLGIITFNQTQQELIEDLLDDARRKNPAIEPFFQPDYFEPVFVKNIENVQGDERDFIFFSICFAKPGNGKRVSMNFGPLNKEGGERRLNVAITRAKESIVVFSSIHYDDLDLNRTSKTGPAHLKNFLEYAEKGSGVLGREITEAHLNEYDSPFEKEVAQFLKNNGYKIHTQVGTSGYRIDLAVISPSHPGRYALGIECDGASYHSAATVRDRDKLRQRVLEGLGWTIIRIWSTDWWQSPEETKRNLLNAVAETIEKDAKNTSNFVPANSFLPVLDRQIIKETDSPKTNDTENDLAACEKALEYPSLDYLNSFKISSQDDFYDPKYNQILRKQIQTILEYEAPITEELLSKRMITIWRFGRTGKQIRNKLQELFSELYSNYSKAGKVYWLHSKQWENYRNFRIAINGCEERELEEIPVEELKNAMEYLLSEYGKFDNDDELFKLTGKGFGFARLTDQARIHYKIAFDLLNR
jgi:superfamily I DNA and RNA helicase subunit